MQLSGTVAAQCGSKSTDGGISACAHSTLQSPCLLELAEQSVVCPQGEVQCPVFVVLGVRLEVLDDVREEVGALHATARSLVAQLGEVDVEVVVGRLVVQIDSQLASWEVVALQDGLLSHNETGIINLFVLFIIMDISRDLMDGGNGNGKYHLT